MNITAYKITIVTDTNNEFYFTAFASEILEVNPASFVIEVEQNQGYKAIGLFIAEYN